MPDDVSTGNWYIGSARSIAFRDEVIAPRHDDSMRDKLASMAHDDDVTDAGLSIAQRGDEDLIAIHQ